MQAYLGHSDVQTTLKYYVHLMDDDKIATSDTMGGDYCGRCKKIGLFGKVFGRREYSQLHHYSNRFNCREKVCNKLKTAHNLAIISRSGAGNRT